MERKVARDELAAVSDVRLEQAAAREWSADAGHQWLDAASIHRHLAANTHQIDAAEAFAWDEVLTDRAAVLDLGCGAGWLAAFLSRRDDVDRIIAWDSSHRLLTDIVPEMIGLFDGEPAKIQRVCGDFTPLNLDDASLDLVVMSSAFHHAPRPDDLLGELARVVRVGGFAVLLNEVPYPVASMLRYIATTAFAATMQAVSPSAPVTKGGWVAAEEILYDPTLGDRARTVSQWRRLFARHPFRVRTVDSGLPPYRAAFRRQPRVAGRLTHFVLSR
jgi:SAM-dependent methyltransferase